MVAVAIEGALRNLVQDVSEDGIELLRSAAQVLGRQEKQQITAEPLPERPPNQPGTSGLGSHSNTAWELFPARQHNRLS